MGLTKQYLRFVPYGKFNIISSSRCNVQFVPIDDKLNRYVAVGAAEDVIIWDTRLAKKHLVIENDKHECVRLCVCPHRNQIAAGYRDGSIVLYDTRNGESISTFVGHTSAITAVTFDANGHRLASGSNDTDIAVWDVVDERGLFRLSGHRAPITQVHFMNVHNIAISSSKDTYIKFWDLSNGHCFKTLAGHVTEVWDFCLVKNDSYLVAGSNDSELRVWRIEEADDDAVKDENYEPITCVKAGVLQRHGLGRVVSLNVDSTSQIVCCHGDEKQLELFRFLTIEEVENKYRKKLKKLKKKQSQGIVNCDEKLEPMSSLKYHVCGLPTVRTTAKIKSADVTYINDCIKVVASLNNNSFELHSLTTDSKDSEFEKLFTSCGHNSDVRSVAFGEDSIGIVSGSATGLKVWNNNTLSCIRTINTDPVLSVCFVPGDRFILAGLKKGSLIIVDIPLGEIVEEIEAHSKEIWRVSTLPSKEGCVSCSSDCTVKLWNFEYVRNEITMSSVLSLIHTRTLTLDEAVLDVRITPGNATSPALVAAALLDNTVKVFYRDSFKFLHDLHGHSLPVTCLDFCCDSTPTLIATGSADKSVKIWGLDFGDCHKSILAHESAVTALCFLPKTRYFFTCGKDGVIHQWDAENYERIFTLRAHCGEAWNLHTSPDGMYVMSCGQDRVIRVFEKSLEPLVLEDERETERQTEEETTLATGEQSMVYGRKNMALASKKTVNSEKGAELLLECLDTIKEYKSSLKQNNNIPLPPIMIAFNAKTTDEYLLAILKKIRSSDMEEILSLLPFASVCELIESLLPLMQNFPYDIELLVRVLTFLLKAHHRPLVSSGTLFSTLKNLQSVGLEKLNELKDMVGCNLYGLYYLQREKMIK